ncbi:hypothetical protein AQS8620_02101 [Aquimixticola soesokkakensis]|uniref:Hedgehog/Intein (Hint) domain-containing protein n=1 Tax=Aquimixticola soesokkakensis TaxID=1519096 RepID=A0A1Y5SW41_9RHOB|nr:Hint domain-containing protein [Aquimixticola soesokkakensis]SLN49358.1 hypothetical protein AQS8620_02101 [Aquimixticola soesokkakensis]
MAAYNLNFFSLSDISTNDPDGFSDNGGYQMDIGTSTVTVAPASQSSVIDINDTNDAFFDDDVGAQQTLNSDQTLNGTFYSAGTIIQSEYELIVQDSLGNTYTLQFISLTADAYNIEGFAIQGPVPPFGEALTVVGRQDMTSGTYSYASASPNCFAAHTRIATPHGEVAAGRLKPGDWVVLAQGGTARIDMILTTPLPPDAPARQRPVRIAAGALDGQVPRHDLLLSPQHRLLLRTSAGEVLAPARALSGQNGIGTRKSGARLIYVHLVLRAHSLLLAEGVPCESFWPGPHAMSTLPGILALRIRKLMGPSPAPVRPILTVAEARRELTRLDLRLGTEQAF